MDEPRGNAKFQDYIITPLDRYLSIERITSYCVKCKGKSTMDNITKSTCTRHIISLRRVMYKYKMNIEYQSGGRMPTLPM